ncbi:hypothetical protein [Natronococcus wangiae]|uniref:hypothetical protein n=1 Tax=Natronococcus wangiae TaxID=3068275 RepID=UPI0027401E3C|nr:hypothetical protein [Natronococcus sp. AD5]
MTRTIKTGKQHIYIRYVKRAEPSRDDDDEADEMTSTDTEASSDDDYFFKYQYELFSFGAILGFLRDEKVDADASYGQDILKVERINEDNSHRQTIDFITKVVQFEEGLDEGDAWEEVLRYADAGVTRFDEETDDDLDFVRFVEDASEELWRDRFANTIGTPGDVGTL